MHATMFGLWDLNEGEWVIRADGSVFATETLSIANAQAWNYKYGSNKRKVQVAVIGESGRPSRLSQADPQIETK